MSKKRDKEEAVQREIAFLMIAPGLQSDYAWLQYLAGIEESVREETIRAECWKRYAARATSGVRMNNTALEWPRGVASLSVSLPRIFPRTDRPMSQEVSEGDVYGDYMQVESLGKDKKHNQEVLSKIPETPRIVAHDVLTDAVREYGNPQMRVKFLSEAGMRSLGMRNYTIVHNEKGEAVRVESLVMAEIPESLARKREEYIFGELHGLRAGNLDDFLLPSVKQSKNEDLIRIRCHFWKWRWVLAVNLRLQRLWIEVAWQHQLGDAYVRTYVCGF